MNVMLKPELEAFVADKVKSGQYANPSELVNEALEALREQEQYSPEQEEYLRREIKKGLDELDAGKYSEFNAEKIIAQERARRGL